MYTIRLQALLFLYCISLVTTGNVPVTLPVKHDPDSLFRIAQLSAGLGRHGLARWYAHQVLEISPGYIDAYLLLARNYGWDSQFDSARVFSGKARALRPDYLDTWLVLIDVERWDSEWAQAEKFLEEAFRYFPGERELEFRLAQVYAATGREREAREILSEILRSGPGYLPARQMLENLPERYANEFLAGYYYDYFPLPYVRRWHMASFGYTRNAGWGNLTGRVSLGVDRGSPVNVQYNLESYPVIDSGRYAYLDYAFSPHSLFPKHRAGAEIFQALPHSFGVSAGFRYFYWNRSFLFFTVSGEKYTPKKWLSARTFVFKKEYGYSAAFYFTCRHYLTDSDNYLQLVVGTGTSPDEPLIAATDLDRLTAFIVKGGFQKKLHDGIFLNTLFGYSYEEYTGNGYRNRFDLFAGLKYRF